MGTDRSDEDDVDTGTPIHWQHTARSSSEGTRVLAPAAKSLFNDS